VGRLEQEVADIRAEAERESAREAERVRQTAAADAEKIRQTAQREIEGAMKAARGELRAFVADQSVALAEGMIRREIRKEDNTRMVNKFIIRVLSSLRISRRIIPSASATDWSATKARSSPLAAFIAP